MSVMAELIRGQTIVDAFVDSEVTYLMLANGTQISISGLVLVQPDSSIARELPPDRHNRRRRFRRE